MDGINQLLNKRTENDKKFGDAENHMQGLYYDLLSCLAGGDHPSLPQNFATKPMTGFLDIVEAFNDVAKLHSAGSGIVCEVGSGEFVQDELPPVASGSQETPDTKTPALKANTKSLKESVMCQDIIQRQSSTDSNQGVDGKTAGNEYTETSALSSSITSHNAYQSTDQEENSSEKAIQIANDEKSEAHVCQNAQEMLKTECSIEAERFNDTLDCGTKELDKKTQKKSHFQFCGDACNANPNYVEEVGPTLTLSSNSPLPVLNLAQQEIDAMEKEIQRYSEELKEIERLLTENLAPSTNISQKSRTTRPSMPDYMTCNVQPIMPTTMIQTLADGLTSPTSALEIIYDMESKRSLHASGFQSCTSFDSWQNEAPANCLSSPCADSVRSASSVYAECLNTDECGGNNNDNAYFKAASFVSQESILTAAANESAAENYQSVDMFREYQGGNNLLAEMVNQFMAAVEVNANDVSCDSVNEESDLQEFADAEDSTKYKRKKKIRFSDKSSISSQEECRWTSASGSEYEDVGDGNANQKVED